MTERLFAELGRHEQDGNNEKIIATVDEIVSINPELTPRLLFRKSAALVELKKYDEAIDYLKENEKYCGEDERYRLYLIIADCYDNLGDCDNETWFLMKSFKAKPTEYAKKKITVNHYLGGKYEDCIEFVECLKENDLADIEDLVNLAFCYNHVGKHDKAIDCANEVLEIDHLNVEMHITLTMAYEAKKDYEKLNETYERILELEGEEEELLLLKAQSCMSLGDEAKSFEYVDKVIKTSPYNPMGYLMKGMLCQCAERHDEAREYFQEAFRLDSSIIEAMSKHSSA